MFRLAGGAGVFFVVGVVGNGWGFELVRAVEVVVAGSAGEAAGGVEAEDFFLVLLVEDLAYRVADGSGWAARGGLGGVEGGERVEGSVRGTLVNQR